MQNQNTKTDMLKIQHAAYWLLFVFALTMMALFFFRLTPELDLYVARLAFTPRPCPETTTAIVCGVFDLQFDNLLNNLREISLRMPTIVGLGISIYMIYQILFNPNTSAEEIRKISFVVWSVLLATVVLVNLILKELWGRPRPFQVDILGGDQPFVLPGTISDYCDSNCSFVSGEASSATWLFTLLVFLPKRWRLASAAVLTGYMVFFSGLRIAFGRHFLSDVVLSVLFTFCIIAALNLLFLTQYFTRIFDKIARWSNQVAFNLKVR